MDDEGIWIDWYRFGEMDLKAAETLRDYSQQKPLEIIYLTTMITSIALMWTAQNTYLK